MSEYHENRIDGAGGDAGDVRRPPVLSDGVVGLRFAAAGPPSPGSGTGVESDEGHQIATTAQGKRGTGGKANPTRNTTTVFQLNQPVKPSKKRRAADNLRQSLRETCTSEQIQDLKPLISRLLENEEKRRQETEKQNEEIRELRQKLRELKEPIQKGSDSKATYATAPKAGAQCRGAAMVNAVVGRKNEQRNLRAEDDGFCHDQHLSL